MINSIGSFVDKGELPPYSDDVPDNSDLKDNEFSRFVNAGAVPERIKESS